MYCIYWPEMTQSKNSLHFHQLNYYASNCINQLTGVIETSGQMAYSYIGKWQNDFIEKTSVF